MKKDRRGRERRKKEKEGEEERYMRAAQATSVRHGNEEGGRRESGLLRST